MPEVQSGGASQDLNGFLLKDEIKYLYWPVLVIVELTIFWIFGQYRAFYCKTPIYRFSGQVLGCHWDGGLVW